MPIKNEFTRFQSLQTSNLLSMNISLIGRKTILSLYKFCKSFQEIPEPSPIEKSYIIPSSKRKKARLFPGFLFSSVYPD